MLTYHQGFDIYHTAFRTLRVLNEAETKSLEKDKLRIIDFIILFPNDLENMKMPVGSTSYRNLYKDNRYNSIPNRKRLFIQLGKYFETSLQCLLTFGILDLESYKNSLIKLVNFEVAKKVLETSLNTSTIDVNIMAFIKGYLFEMNLHELKKRTELIEYRYDLFTSQ